MSPGRQAEGHHHRQPGLAAQPGHLSHPRQRRLGARLLPQVPEQAPRLPRRLVERSQLGRSHQALRKSEEVNCTSQSSAFSSCILGNGRLAKVPQKVFPSHSTWVPRVPILGPGKSIQSSDRTRISLQSNLAGFGVTGWHRLGRKRDGRMILPPMRGADPRGSSFPRVDFRIRMKSQCRSAEPSPKPSPDPGRPCHRKSHPHSRARVSIC